MPSQLFSLFKEMFTSKVMHRFLPISKFQPYLYLFEYFLVHQYFHLNILLFLTFMTFPPLPPNFLFFPSEEDYSTGLLIFGVKPTPLSLFSICGKHTAYF